MSSMALSPNPQTNAGTGGAGWINAAPTDDPNYQVAPVQAFGLPANNMLPQQIGWSDLPLGAYTDDQFLADDAALRAQVGQNYAQILNQLGYQDPNTGAVIPGSVVQDANIKLAAHQQELQDAERQVTQQAQQGGTLWSGARQQALASAQLPIMQNIGQLHLDTQRTLSDLYQQAQNMVTNYNVQRQQNLGSAAARNLARIQQEQMLAALNARNTPDVGGGGGGGDAGLAPSQIGTDAGQYTPPAPVVGYGGGGGGLTHYGDWAYPATVPSVGYGGASGTGQPVRSYGDWTYPISTPPPPKPAPAPKPPAVSQSGRTLSSGIRIR